VPGDRARRTRRRAAPLAAALILALSPLAATAVDRDVARAIRGAYEGRTLRLRHDLRSAAHAVEPNVFAIGGMGYGSETSPVLFWRLETVFLDRVTSEGGSRVSLTIYRSADDARNMRATAIPAPSLGNPAADRSQVAFARTDSTSVMLELAAGRKDPEGQRREITTLMERLFYIDADPTRAEIEGFVLQHRDWTVSRLASITGLTPDDVRAVITGAPRAP
jgi:hypothetical protein